MKKEAPIYRVVQFVPGDNPKALAKILDPNIADLVIINWEAAIVDKGAARATTITALREYGPAVAERAIVRVNAIPTGHAEADLEALFRYDKPLGIRGILAPLIEGPADVRWWHRHMTSESGSRAAKPPELHILMETPKAVLHASEIGHTLEQTPNPGTICAGLADYTTAAGLWETGQEPERNCSVFLQAVVAAARGYGLTPIGPVPPNVADDATPWGVMCRDMGFAGCMTIHPRQRDGIVNAFTPSEARLKKAQERLLKLTTSKGAAVRMADGSVVEKPMCGPDLLVCRYAVLAGLIPAAEYEVYERMMSTD